MEMLAEWLQQDYNVSHNGVPSWSVLVAALRKMGENDLAKRIMVSYEYNIVMVCAVNKWSLSQEGEVMEEEVGDRRKRRGGWLGEKEYNEEEEEGLLTALRAVGV